MAHRILVVDDDSYVRTLVVKILDERGYLTMRVAGDGCAAATSDRSHNP
jgi:CheY-like chemotaxis protein